MYFTRTRMRKIFNHKKPHFTRKTSHSTPQAEDEMKGRLFLDIVVGQGPTIFQLLSSKDQSLLVWWNTFLILDLSLYIFDGVRRLNLQRDGFTSQSFHKDLHTTPQPQDKVQGRLLLNVVIREGSPVLKLLPSEDEPLLIWRNSLLILDFGLHVLNRIRWLHFKSDGFASQGLDEDLHPSSQPEDEVQGRSLLDIVIG